MNDDLIRQVYANDLYAIVERAFRALNPGEAFIGGYYLRALCNVLERVAAGELQRVIIVLPPRHLKSQTTSVAFPARLLGCDPTKKIVCASYSAALADDFGLQTRRLMKMDFYRKTFP